MQGNNLISNVSTSRRKPLRNLRAGYGF